MNKAGIFIVAIIALFNGIGLMNYGFKRIPPNVNIEIPGNGNIIVFGGFLTAVGIILGLIILIMVLLAYHKKRFIPNN